MKCPVCSEELNDRANFCPICGHKITEKERFAYAEELMANPELAPAPDFEKDYEPVHVEEGSFFAGLVLGFLFNLLGVIIAIATRGRQTKRGSGIGFLISAALGIIWFFLWFFWIRHYIN